jgi:orotidine-5'-phosphate decarboxylase
MLRATGVASSPQDQVVRLAKMARDQGLDGVVASPHEVSGIRQGCGNDFIIVTPGIRTAGASATDDQRRTATPTGALAAGSSYLVIGRPIAAASDPRAAAEGIARDIAAAHA